MEFLLEYWTLNRTFLRQLHVATILPLAIAGKVHNALPSLAWPDVYRQAVGRQVGSLQYTSTKLNWKDKFTMEDMDGCDYYSVTAELFL